MSEKSRFAKSFLVELFVYAALVVAYFFLVLHFLGASLNTALGRNLRSEKEALTKFGVDAAIKLRHGLVVAEIFQEMEEGDYDMVVTGSARAGGPLHTYIMGDITSEVVNRAHRPVLVVRGGARPAHGFFGRLGQFFTGSGA